MRFGSSSRIWSALVAMFSSAPATRRSSIRARHEMQALAEPVDLPSTAIRPADPTG